MAYVSPNPGVGDDGVGVLLKFKACKHPQLPQTDYITPYTVTGSPTSKQRKRGGRGAKNERTVRMRQAVSRESNEGRATRER